MTTLDTARHDDITEPGTGLRSQARLATALSPLLVALLAVVLRATHVTSSYDLFVDEPFYVEVGRSVASGGMPFATGSYFFLHPPGFFLLEALWAHLFGTAGNVFDQVFRVRYLNVALSGGMTLLLWSIARRLGGPRAAVIAASIYALDPWLIRQNSLVLLETATLAWVLLGYLLLLTAPSDRRRDSRLLWAGLALGMGVLTKEYAVFVTIVPVAILLWRRWWLTRRESARVIVATCVPFAVWVVIVVATGHSAEFWIQVTSGFRRTAGTHQISGFNSPDAPSFVTTVIANAAQFWTTYLVLALGCAAGILLLKSRRQDHRVLGALLAGAVPTLVYGVLVGANEEQFFNFLMIPAILALATVVTVRSNLWRRFARPVIALAVMAVIANLITWSVIHFVPDDGTKRVDDWMRQHANDGTTVAVTNPVQRQIFLRYRMVNDTSETSLNGSGAQYLVVFRRQVAQGYAFISPTALATQVGGLRPEYSRSTRGNGRIEVYALR